MKRLPSAAQVMVVATLIGVAVAVVGIVFQALTYSRGGLEAEATPFGSGASNDPDGEPTTTTEEPEPVAKEPAPPGESFGESAVEMQQWPMIVGLKDGEQAVLLGGDLVLGVSFFWIGTNARPTLHISVAGGATENVPLHSSKRPTIVAVAGVEFLISVLEANHPDGRMRLRIDRRSK